MFSRWAAVLALALMAPVLAWAQDDPPGRVGRIADLQGGVSIYDFERGEWAPAVRNRPLTNGDRVSTDGDARAELRIGSTTLRLAAGSELEVLQLDDDHLTFQLHSGGLALRVRSREVADETEIVTAEARLRPLRAGHFRIDRIDDSTFASSWRGELRVVDDGEAFNIDTGRRAEIWREGSRRDLRHSWTPVPDDAFADWVAREDRRDERSASNRYVSPEMTGAEDLDRDGRWEQHPEFGAVWVPLAVQAGWAPYRFGHWAWIRPWGWTWVDDARWGFAPFHYGRWVSWSGRWCWSPGGYVARPVYAPALVAWVGGPHLNVSVSIGGPALPAVGWVPLAPRDVFVPYYPGSPRYVDRVNHHPPGRPRPQVPTGPIMYGNQGVPGAVTVVPRDVLIHRQPVARAVIDVREPMQRGSPVRMAPVAAPAAPPAVAAVGAAPGRPMAIPPPPSRVPRPVSPQVIAPPVGSPQGAVPQVVPVPGGGEPAFSRQRREPLPAQQSQQAPAQQPQRAPATPPAAAPPVPAAQPAPVAQPVPVAPPAAAAPTRPVAPPAAEPAPRAAEPPRPHREFREAPPMPRAPAAAVAVPPGVVDLRHERAAQPPATVAPAPAAPTPAPARAPAPAPAPAAVPTPPPARAPAPAPAPAAAPTPQPAPAPAPAPAARPRPVEKAEAPREEGRQRTPESRNNQREQLR